MPTVWGQLRRTLIDVSTNAGSASSDLLVVGGGAIGLAIAWEAARNGRSVRICDPDPGHGASWVAAGMLAPINEAHFGEDDRLPVALAALNSWKSFAAEVTQATGQPIGLREEGSIVVAYDTDDRVATDRMRLFHASLGLTATELTIAECRKLEPWLSPDIAGGTLVEGDLSVNNRALVEALLRANELCGVEFDRRHVSAIQLDTTGARARGVIFDDGDHANADVVVLAAGTWSALVQGLPAQVVPPVHPRKGQILRLRATAEQPQPLTRSLIALVQGSNVYLVPRSNGELVIGATQEDRGFHTSVTAGGIWELLRDARLVIPAIGEMEIGEMAAGLRPATPDNAAIVGRTEIDGLLIATGHGRNGILFTPLTAQIINDLIEGRAPIAQA